MNVNRIYPVSDSDALDTIRQFLDLWWQENQLEALLAPVESSEPGVVRSTVITNREDLSKVNPFAPVMLSNAARSAIQFSKEHPGQNLAIIVRPCELRALSHLTERKTDPLDLSTMTVIGVDCLGTFTPKEFHEMVNSMTAEEITKKILYNASAGGLQPQRYRTACHICDWPAPRGADFSIAILGVSNQDHLLLIADDEEADQRLGLDDLAPTLATEYQVSHRETIIGALMDLRSNIRRNMVEEMRSSCRFDDLGCLLAWLSNCNMCGKCLSACPIYAGELNGLFGRGDQETRSRAPLAALMEISHWLASCAGCGMCDENCDQEVPLILIVSALSHRIRSEVRYAQENVAQRYPWSYDLTH